ncbi:hypothetical protein TRFO_17421 [Tritrichomonas foetus]|uniref:RRM domain-containing protein n=1 Tax=Tritrichomonas foetus TaxID=1144522 RepID=A0A1J4KSA6_9EUKA|nr:hypothetical protein TRFO_17421 [Tritrichomonas foetus]|eukprot:OHT12700.1 hypothetical protein TRFO_17421 [Tritrichomonas foetus]
MSYPKNPVARPRQFQPHKTRAFSQLIDKPSHPQQSHHRPLSHHVDPTTNLFVNYLPAYYGDTDLRNLVAPYGQIICSKIMVNLETGESKCFGFVRLANLQQAQNAITALNGMQLGHKRLLVKYAESKEKNDPESDLIYVKQIPLMMNQTDIAQLFSPFGHLVQVVPHMIDNIDPTVWRCFIRFDSIESAASAIFEMNNKIIVMDSKPIHVRFADPNCIPNVQNTLNYYGQFNNAMNGSVHHLNNNVNNHAQTQRLDEIDEAMLLPSFLVI